MLSPGMSEKLKSSILRLETWVEENRYKGPDPYDGLSSVFRPLTFHNAFAERVLKKFVLECPFNLRPILGVRPLESTKGRGYMVSGYMNLLKITGDESYRRKALSCLDWLIQNKSPRYAPFSWGGHYDSCSRLGKLPMLEPTIVWTALLGQVFLDAYEMFGHEEYLDVADSACQWIVNVPRERTDSGSCLSYVAFEQRSAHNSNFLGAGMLARAGQLTRNSDYLKVAKEAVDYSCARQLPNGGWYYAEAGNSHWIDSFHTGYNLDSLRGYIEITKENGYRAGLSRGYRFFRDHFFDDQARPKYYHDRLYPIDIQCVSQAIETLVKFAPDDATALPLALDVADWAIDHMQDEKGYFYFRKWPGMSVKIPMFQWGQATMYKSLTMLWSQIGAQSI
jgi:hypothetical protein